LKEYEEFATCGFCKYHNQVFHSQIEDVCSECEIKKISKMLEELCFKKDYDHDHKYCPDDDEDVARCVHCEHAIFFMVNRYDAAQYSNECWCALDDEETNQKGATHKSTDHCEKWQRAVDRRPFQS